MTTDSVSFRITRHTEDLALTIHALSQRVVQLEQRLAGLEEHISRGEEAPTGEHLASLANVDQLLSDCRELLAVAPAESVATPQSASPLQAVPGGAAEDLEPLDDVA